MANEYVNKVVLGSSTLIDLTADTVTADTLMQGYTAHDKSGALITGTASATGGVTQDQDGYLVLDDEGGGSSVTVEALSVTANGTYTAPTGHAYSPVTVAVSSGGGGDTGNRSDPIRFFDYDGTLVASYSSVPSALPSVPTHDKLTNGTWNHTLAQVTTQFNATGTCDVGANYDTASGATEIDIVLDNAGRLHPYLSLAVNGTVSIDWGDGSTPSTSTGTSLTSRKTDIHHEYAAAGSYTIKVSKTSGTGYSLYCTSSIPLLNANSSTAAANYVYSFSVQAVRVGTNCTIGTYAFYYCMHMRSVSIPSDRTTFGNYAFGQCGDLQFVSIPSDLTSAGSYAFTSCGYNKAVSIPAKVSAIGAGLFASNYLLQSISVPASVSSIGASAFSNCYGISKYHFCRATPPTLENTNAFSGIAITRPTIYVPSESLEAYQTATNWSTYASYMVGE